jgi:predicted O-methyltransferase YrrM
VLAVTLATWEVRCGCGKLTRVQAPEDEPPMPPLCDECLPRTVEEFRTQKVEKMVDVQDLDALQKAIEPIHGWWQAESGRALYQLVKRLDGNVLELGSWCGRSTAWIAAALEARGAGVSGTVDTIDTWEGSPKEPLHAELIASLPPGSTLQDLWAQNLAGLGLRSRVCGWQYTTDEAFVLFKKRFDEDIEQVYDVLLIDADHSYEAVKRDFENYSKLVRFGGYVIFDDVPSWHGPTKVHRELDPRIWKLIEYWPNQAVFRRMA